MIMPGSKEKRGPNTYRLVVSAGRSPDGKRKKLTKTIKVEGRTEAEQEKKAEKELAKFIAEVEKDDYVEPSKLTLKAFSEKWLKDYAEEQLAPKTTHEYKGLLNKRILPAMGHLKISAIKTPHLLAFFSNLKEEGMREDGKKGKLSKNTILHYYRLLSVMFNTAVKWELIPSNPILKIDKPKLPDNERDFYDENEVAILIEKLMNENLKRQVAILLALTGGLRAGEVTGLKWENVDFDNNQIAILETTQYIAKTGVFEKSPKNETSKRIISLPSTTMDILKYLQDSQEYEKEDCGDLWIDSGYVLTQWNGVRLHPDTPGKWFNKIIKKYGLKKITFHELRHTSATLLIDQGENVKTLSQRLGHAETSTTMNIYAHSLKRADKSAANKLENLIFKKPQDLV
jgi:integrase